MQLWPNEPHWNHSVSLKRMLKSLTEDKMNLQIQSVQKSCDYKIYTVDNCDEHRFKSHITNYSLFISGRNDLIFVTNKRANMSDISLQTSEVQAKFYLTPIIL